MFVQLLPFYSVPNLINPSIFYFISISIVILFISCSFPLHPPIMQPFSIGELTSNAMIEVERVLLVHFVEAMKINEFRSSNNLSRLHLEHFLNWIMSWNLGLAKNLLNMWKERKTAGSKSLRLTMLASFFDPNLQEIETEMVCKVLQASLAVAKYAEKEHRVREFI